MIFCLALLMGSCGKDKKAESSDNEEAKIEEVEIVEEETDEDDDKVFGKKMGSSSSDNDYYQPANGSDVNEVLSSSGDSSDWDSVLDSYEKYVNKLVSVSKKISNGNPSAIAEYTSLVSEAQELSEKLSGAESEMTSAQQARYLRITSKMSNAVASMN